MTVLSKLSSVISSIVLVLLLGNLLVAIWVRMIVNSWVWFYWSGGLIQKHVQIPRKDFICGSLGQKGYSLLLKGGFWVWKFGLGFCIKFAGGAVCFLWSCWICWSCSKLLMRARLILCSFGTRIAKASIGLRPKNRSSPIGRASLSL